ncbi:GTP binding protein Bms1 [Histoplasma ohiense]|nr:GTP binding protein Bms1 [Histoplasma ohiense (nom. inval.)]
MTTSNLKKNGKTMIISKLSGVGLPVLKFPRVTDQVMRTVVKMATEMEILTLMIPMMRETVRSRTWKPERLLVVKKRKRKRIASESNLKILKRREKEMRRKRRS